MVAESPNASLYVGLKAAQTNYYADMQASRLGLPINVRVTINFTLLGHANNSEWLPPPSPPSRGSSVI